MIVDEEYRVNIYLDTNILVDYIEGTYPLLNQSIELYGECNIFKFKKRMY